MKHIICYSGGVESALATIEVARKFGTKDMVLLNHDISPDAEEPDIKRYKQDIADYFFGDDLELISNSEQPSISYPFLKPQAGTKNEDRN